MYMKYLSALTFACVLTGCSKSTPTDQTPVQSPTPVATAASDAGACISNAKVAVDFVNLYVRHLNANEAAANPTDTYEWLKKNSLADPSVASAYATYDLIDGDPILNAQDYPDKFESAGCPTRGVVELRGVGKVDLKVLVKVAPLADGAKVIGVGLINMPAQTTEVESAVLPANSIATSSKSPSGAVGTNEECVTGQDGAADLGSSYDNGMYLCREIIDGPYYNEWYAVVEKGRSSTYRVIADGKVMFEGLLTINCSGESTSWAKVEDFDTDAVDLVPAAAVDNVLQIACRS